CWSSVYIVEGLPVPEQAQLPTSSFNLITPGYFSTMGIPLIEGRLFNADDGAASPEVIIVNESMAKRWWPGGSALGHRVKQGFPQDKTPWREIVGVVADTRQMGPEQPADTEVFLPFDQMADTALSLVVLSSAPPATLAPAVRREIARLDAAQPVDNVRTMEEYLSLTMARRRFSTLLLGLFAGLALLLSAVGIYSVVSCGVSMRTREFGVRMALGAARGDVLRLVLVQGARLALVGVGAGLAGALALTRLMAGLLYGVGPTDPITFASLAALLAVVAVASCSVPAWRATRVDPMVALRHE
ncbi:MAG TPA: FtsX-like permease family protein, partial [Candidatus Polarisedimenticolia bacterium]|nr:FtsX-like permease family protein [Candidatus Polarisedimenticolia bacterium]